jgi:hypothetical protein
MIGYVDYRHHEREFPGNLLSLCKKLHLRKDRPTSTIVQEADDTNSSARVRIPWLVEWADMPPRALSTRTANIQKPRSHLDTPRSLGGED